MTSTYHITVDAATGLDAIDKAKRRARDDHWEPTKDQTAWSVKQDALGRWAVTITVTRIADRTRWDAELGETQRWCASCREWWPQTPDFWIPRDDARCRACKNEAKAARNRARYRADPEYRERRLRLQRASYAQLMADTERHQAFLAERRDAARAASQRKEAA